MMSAAAALLSASGERPVGQSIGIGQALGNAMLAGQQGYSQAQQGAIANLMAKEKLREAKMNADWAAGGGVVPTAPVAGVPAGAVAGAVPTYGPPAMAGSPAPMAAPVPAGMVNIGGFNVTPTQAAILRQMPRKDAMGEILKMTNTQYSQMSPEEIAATGLQPNSVVFRAPTGKPEVIYRPDYQYVETPSGGKQLIDMNNPLGTVTPRVAKAAVASGAAPAPSAAPAAGGAPTYGGGMAPALKPEQIMTATQDWDTKYRTPVESILQSYGIVKDLVTTGQGGISDYGVLIKSIKALDPTSAVMQGEANAAAQMQGMADRMQGYLDKIQSGGVGSEQARLDLANLARSSAKMAMETYNRQASRKSELLSQYAPASVIKSTFQPYVIPPEMMTKEAMQANMKANTVAPAAGTLTFDPVTKTWGYK
jgi:hypothetical protein